MSNVEGTFQSLLGSIQSHFEDRLKSPFGGAFVISWVAINWKAVAILFASNSSIEDRIKVVSDTYFTNAWTYLWLPLICAGVGVLAYYALSAIFVIFHEIYGMARRFIERKFDSYRWVPPVTYIEMKRIGRERIEELSSLAADQLGAIEKLRESVSLAESDRAIAQSKLEEESKRVTTAEGLLEIQVSMNQGLEAEAERTRKELAKLSDKYTALAEAARRLENASKFAEGQLESYLRAEHQVAMPVPEERKRRPLNLLTGARSELWKVLNESSPDPTQPA